MSRTAPRTRTLLGCVAAAVLLAACGGTPDTHSAPDLRTLPSPIATVPPPAPPGGAGKSKSGGQRSGRSNVGVGPGSFVPVGGDEFNSASLNLNRWGLYNSKGGFGNGLRRPSAITQSGGSLTITAADDTSGGMAQSYGQLYGRWEVRARTDDGRGFGSAILLWPDSEKLSDGEVDIAEVPSEHREMAHFVLHSGSDGNTLDGSHTPGDYSQWHTFAVDWLPDHITWYLDGRSQFTVTDPTRIPDTRLHLAIQLDEGPVNDWMLAPDATTPPQIRLQVDWVHQYKWVAAPAPAASTGSSQPDPG